MKKLEPVSVPFGNLLTSVEKVHHQKHRSKFILHTLTGRWHIADFANQKQLDEFAKLLGFSYTLDEEKEIPDCGLFRMFYTDHQIVEGSPYPFQSLKDLPAGAQPIKALSNGSIVDCYFHNDGKVIRLYRPNSNCKDIYHPLDLSAHLRHVKEHGLY